MEASLRARACAILALLAFCTSANATFHLWQISEIYSNAGGSVQFIELSTSFGSQEFVTGHAINTSQGAATHSFTLTSDLPGSSTNKTFLIGTASFAALNLVTPDYVVPDNFLFLPNGTIDWAGADTVSYASLPTDGIHSINRSGVVAVNSPRNFAGATGTVVPTLPPVCVPGSPTIGSALAGNAQVTISFTPPTSNGCTITGYTVTCNPGALSASGQGSPIVLAGLANGTAYTCSVSASGSAGPGSPSPTVTVTPIAVATSASGPSATGTGTIAASFTGGGATCGFTVAQFIPLQAGPASPPAGSAPAGLLFPQGLFDFTVAGCTAGSTITMAVVYPTPLPAGAQYWKYGPTAAQPAPHWYILPAAIAGNTATFAITDGGLGDDDLAANGTIADQGGPGVPGAAGAIPTLSEWALIALAAMLAAFGLAASIPRRG